MAPKYEKIQTIAYSEINKSKLLTRCPLGVSVMAVNASDKESVFENQLKMKDIKLHFNPKTQFMSIPTEVRSLEGGIPACIDFKIGKGAAAYSYDHLIKKTVTRKKFNFKERTYKGKVFTYIG